MNKEFTSVFFRCCLALAGLFLTQTASHAQLSTCTAPAANGSGDAWSPECYLDNACGLLGNPCDAKDVYLSAVQVGYSCNSGSTATLSAGLTFKNQVSANRYAVRSYVELFVNGVFVQAFQGCVADQLTPGQSVVQQANFNVACGATNMELRNLWIAWDDNAATCAGSGACGNYTASECLRNAATGFALLSPSFTVACGAGNNEVCFTNTTTGGTQPYTFLWNFGDGATSGVRSLCHVFSGPGPYTVTLTATDANSSTVTITQTVSLNCGVCTTPPNITCPAPASVSCAADIPPANPADVTATSDCAASVNVSFQGDVTTQGSCANNFSVARTYRATDEFGHTAACVQTITVSDNTVPTILCPANVTVSCASEAPVPNTSAVVVSDNCGSVAGIDFSPDVVTGKSCANRYTSTRVYTARDACGNTASCAQTITVADNTAPSISCPAAITVSCAGQVPAPSKEGVVSSDNCGGGPEITFMPDATGNQACTNQYTLTRTYIATDACGNSTACVQSIRVLDNSGPSITCPVNVTVSCSGQVPAPNISSVVSSDACGGTMNITFAPDAITNQTCTDRYTSTRIYTARDACNNSATCAQVITVADNTAPVITSCPSGNVSLSCESEIPDPNPADVVAQDNCGPVTARLESRLSSGEGCASSPLVMTYTYSATDPCGNVSTCTQTFRVVDQTPPVYTGPATIGVCQNDIPGPQELSVALAPYVSDNCQGGVTASVAEVLPGSANSASYVVVIQDRCGNAADKFVVTFAGTGDCPPASLAQQTNQGNTTILPNGVQADAPGKLSQVRLAPNPVRDLVTIRFETVEESEVQIRFTGSAGVQSETTVRAVKGMNEFSFPTKSFPAGLYTISLKGNGDLQTLRMVKVKD